MARVFISIFCTAVLLILSACTGLPPMVPFASGSKLTTGEFQPAAGPKIEELMVNLKCELVNAANDSSELPYYDDVPDDDGSIPLHTLNPNGPPDPKKKPAKKFTLANFFQEVEYVADIQWTLEVTDTGGFNPSVNLTKPFNVAVGELPATNAVLAVNGGLSEAGDRNLILYQTVDFSRLLPPVSDHPQRPNEPAPLTQCPKWSKSNKSRELGGDLGLTEDFQAALISEAMSNISAYPDLSTGSTLTKADSSGQYGFGIISTQVNFTIIENLSGGPTWSLKYFKGPSGASTALLNFNRQVKDTLQLTMVPICVRSTYTELIPPQPAPVPGTSVPPGSASPANSANGSSAVRHTYNENLMYGTPGWVNYLPSCATPNPGAVNGAIAAAMTININNSPLRQIINGP